MPPERVRPVQPGPYTEPTPSVKGAVRRRGTAGASQPPREPRRTRASTSSYPRREPRFATSPSADASLMRPPALPCWPSTSGMRRAGETVAWRCGPDHQACAIDDELRGCLPCQIALTLCVAGPANCNRAYAPVSVSSWIVRSRPSPRSGRRLSAAAVGSARPDRPVSLRGCWLPGTCWASRCCGHPTHGANRRGLCGRIGYRVCSRRWDGAAD
jgi:hypothetical protein